MAMNKLYKKRRYGKIGIAPMKKVNEELCDKEIPAYRNDPKVKKHLRQMKHCMHRNLVSAYKGWWQWKRIKRIEGFGQTAVILLPEKNREINRIALCYLDQLLEVHHYTNAVILSVDSDIKEAAPLFSDKILRVKTYSRRKAHNLLQLYCLLDFDERFVCASLQEPFGRKGDQVVGLHGTTTEEAFVVGVYGIYPFVPMQLPRYDGENPILTHFLQENET